MTPRDWAELCRTLDEEIPSWEWIAGGKQIGILAADSSWITICDYRGEWLVEVERKSRAGNYFDQPEYEYSHSFSTDNVEDLVTHIRSINSGG